MFCQNKINCSNNTCSKDILINIVSTISFRIFKKVFRGIILEAVSDIIIVLLIIKKERKPVTKILTKDVCDKDFRST